MRAICCAILSYVAFYIASNTGNKENPVTEMRGFFVLLSWVLFGVSAVLVVFGL